MNFQVSAGAVRCSSIRSIVGIDWKANDQVQLTISRAAGVLFRQREFQKCALRLGHASAASTMKRMIHS